MQYILWFVSAGALTTFIVCFFQIWKDSPSLKSKKLVEKKIATDKARKILSELHKGERAEYGDEHIPLMWGKQKLFSLEEIGTNERELKFLCRRSYFRACARMRLHNLRNLVGDFENEEGCLFTALRETHLTLTDLHTSVDELEELKKQYAKKGARKLVEEMKMTLKKKGGMEDQLLRLLFIAECSLEEVGGNAKELGL